MLQIRKVIKLNIDKEADVLYLRLDDSPIVESEEVSPGIAPDYNEADEVVGVEMQHLSRRSSELNLSLPEFETIWKLVLQYAESLKGLQEALST